MRKSHIDFVADVACMDRIRISPQIFRLLGFHSPSHGMCPADQGGAHLGKVSPFWIGNMMKLFRTNAYLGINKLPHAPGARASASVLHTFRSPDRGKEGNNSSRTVLQAKIRTFESAVPRIVTLGRLADHRDDCFLRH